MLFGLVVGIVAKLLMPGQHPGGIIATILIGIVGAWLGGLLGRTLGLYPAGHPAGFIMAVIGAMILLVIYGYATKPSTTSAMLNPPAGHALHGSLARHVAVVSS
jgi:uncharacterized membrane protein YeaQ/YmgE (transglycosylase-associated protein family)